MTGLDIAHEGRQLRLIKGFCVKEQQWVLIEKDRVYFVKVKADGYAIEDYIPLREPIWNVTLDASLKSNFMAFITENYTVILLVKEKDKWHYCHRFKTPDILLKKLCFLYPGAGTSTTNRFRDKVFLLLMGDLRHNHGVSRKHIMEEEDFEEGVEKVLIPDNHLDRTRYTSRSTVSLSWWGGGRQRRRGVSVCDWRTVSAPTTSPSGPTSTQRTVCGYTSKTKRCGT